MAIKEINYNSYKNSKQIIQNCIKNKRQEWITLYAFVWYGLLPSSNDRYWILHIETMKLNTFLITHSFGNILTQ